MTEALAPHGLALRSVGGGKYVVVEADNPVRPSTSYESTPPLEEVTVYASRYSIDTQRASQPRQLSSTEVQNVPGSHDDPLRALRVLPGLATGVSSRPYIRGSLSDDVLVRYDGVNILDPYHLKAFQSLYGAIDPLAIGGMEVYSGGYPVRYGTRSGGVIDIEPRHGIGSTELDLTVSQLSVGAAASGASRRWPIEWLVSIRRNTTNLLLEPIESQEGDPQVIDAMGRLLWKLDGDSDIRFGWLLLEDRISFGDVAADEVANAHYRDQYLWLAYQMQPMPDWKARTTLAFTGAVRTRDGHVNQVQLSTGQVDESRNFHKVELSSDWIYNPAAGNYASLGGSLAHSESQYRYSRALAIDPAIAAAFQMPDNRDTAGNGVLRGTTFSTYGSVGHRWPRFEAEVGLRMDGQDFGGEVTHLQWSPRLNLRYDLTSTWRAYGSIGRFTQAQAVEELRTEELQQQPDPAQVAVHTVFGISHESPAGLHWGIEYYVKHWTKVSPYFESLLDPSALLPDLLPDRRRIAPRDSEASGMEFNVRGRLTDRLQGWASITAARVTDRVGAQDQSRSWDQPWSANLGLAWSTDHLNLSAMVGRHTGWPRTPVTVDAATGLTVALASRNSHRWNDFVSLDLRGSWKRSTEFGELTLFADATNASNRRNLCCSVLIPPASEAPTLSIERKSWLPRVLNLGFSLRWVPGQ